MNREPKKSVCILLPISLYCRLTDLAAEDDHTFSAEVRQILRGYTEYIGRGGVSWCRKGIDRGIERYHKP